MKRIKELGIFFKIYQTIMEVEGIVNKELWMNKSLKQKDAGLMKFRPMDLQHQEKVKSSMKAEL